MPVLDSLRATARLHSQHRWELQNGVLWRTDRCADISQERGEHPNDPNERSERFRPAKRQPRCPAAPPWRTGAGLPTPFQEEWIGVRPWPLMDVVTFAVPVVKATNPTARGGGGPVSRKKATSSILPKWQWRLNRKFTLRQLRSPALLLGRPFKQCDCHSVKSV